MARSLLERSTLHGFLTASGSILIRTQAKIRIIQNYWVVIRANPRSQRPPVATLLAFAANIAIYYCAPGRGMSYASGAQGAWFAPLGAMFSHVSEEHLWSNMIMLALLGTFLEVTEGLRTTLSVLVGGGMIGAAAHGIVKPDTAVRGASGAVYGALGAQCSLLILNHREMPLRWVRWIACAAVLCTDVALYMLDRQQGISYISHLAGAVAGVAITLVFGNNVKLRRHEVPLVVAGAVIYTAMVVGALLLDQFAAASLAAALVPFLWTRTALTILRACARRSPDSPALGETELPLMRQGTQLALQALFGKRAGRDRVEPRQEVVI